MAHQGNTEVVAVWDPIKRCQVVLVDGQFAARTRPAVAGGRISKGVAADRLDVIWLERAIRDLLDGTVRLREAIAAEDGAPAVRSERRITSKAGGKQSSYLAHETWAPSNGFADRDDWQLASLACPVCGESMILRFPAWASKALLCPLCASLQLRSAAAVISNIARGLRAELGVPEDGLPEDMRQVLEAVIGLLERLERVLDELGPDEATS